MPSLYEAFSFVLFYAVDAKCGILRKLESDQRLREGNRVNEVAIRMNGSSLGLSFAPRGGFDGDRIELSGDRKKFLRDEVHLLNFEIKIVHNFNSISFHLCDAKINSFKL